MTNLKNEFSWSKTWDEIFKIYPRQYWFGYYGFSSGGWDLDSFDAFCLTNKDKGTR